MIFTCFSKNEFLFFDSGESLTRIWVLLSHQMLCRNRAITITFAYYFVFDDYSRVFLKLFCYPYIFIVTDGQTFTTAKALIY